MIRVTLFGELVYFDGQRDRVLNIYESEVGTDGTLKLSGGCPIIKLSSSDSSLPQGTDISNKSGYSVTFIGCSTLEGWPIPPHLQVKREAMAKNIILSLGFFQDVKIVRGKFGFDELKGFGMTFGANPKAGMDSIEFSKYIFSTNLILYPNVKDITGKRVAIIVDSGPGRVNSSMLVKLRIMGYYLIPEVPNITHVTQATDRNSKEFSKTN